MGKKHKRKHKAAGSDRPSRVLQVPDAANAMFVATDPGHAAFVATDLTSVAFVATKPIVAEDAVSPAPAPDVAHETTTPSEEPDPATSSSEAQQDAGPPLDGRLVAGCDVDADNAADVAPVGPTEPGLSSGFGQDQEDPQSAQRFGVEPSDATTPAAPATNADDIQQQIRDLEARLDQMFGKTREGSERPPAPVPADKPSSPTSVPPRPAAGPATADEVLSPEFCARQWGREGLRSRSEEVDEFGLDPTFERRLLPTLDFLCNRYFRVAVDGTEHIPVRGRCLIVANHSGGPLPDRKSVV